MYNITGCGQKMRKVLLIQYGEIALRGKNRRIHEGALMDTILKRIGSSDGYVLIREQGRVLLENKNGDVDYGAVVPPILKIPGIYGICEAVMTTDMSIENLREIGLAFMREHHAAGGSFKVLARRADKRYPLTSPEIGMEIGGYIHDNMAGLTVDLSNPQITLRVELRNSAYIFSDIKKGIGGLPVGSAGKGMLLLSGGIDSPVAGYMVARRGVELYAAYFHSPPYTSERAKIKVCDLAQQLAAYAGSVKLYVVPFTDIQLYLNEKMPPEKLTIFLKRSMIKAAERIAVQSNCLCLITGDAIGQVASQTLTAIHATNAAATLPIIRPLAAFDKQDIIDIAQRIGTFEISVRPYEDCCTVFVAKHPDLKPKLSVIERMEQRAGELPGLIDDAVEKAELLEFYAGEL
jgi:thiamine biosynthesis protein ThiI